jgi:hypothetical protein
MRARSLGIVIGLSILLFSDFAAAGTVFPHDAASIGEHHVAVSADLSAGRDRFLNDWNALGMRARFDIGVTRSLQLGAWVAATYGSGVCIDARGGGGGCIDTSTLAGGARMRLGLWRSSGDLLHIGVEAGLSARPVPDTVFILGIFAEANAQASLKVANVGLAYGRVGMAAIEHVTSSARPRPMGTLALGFEFLPGRIHPFIEGSGSALYSFASSSSTIEASALVGISAAW